MSTGCCSFNWTHLLFKVYIAEVSSARFRGGLGSVNQLAVTVGILLAYLVGFSVSKAWTAMFAVILVALMVILLVFMPETPHWLLAHNYRHTAIKNLRWLRGPEYDVEEECFEIESNLGIYNCFSFSQKVAILFSGNVKIRIIFFI